MLASPLRRLLQNPSELLAPYVREGMRVLEPGPGMGFFTLDLARLAGESGRIIAVDLQPRMLKGLERRARRQGLDQRIETRVAQPDRLGVADLAGSLDFILAFAMIHELPSAHDFFAEVAPCLKPNGKLLLAEPAGHVPDAVFEGQIKAAELAGLALTERPKIRRSLTALLERRD